MKLGIGVLMSAGWTLDEILDLSVSQIAVSLDCVMTYKAEQLDLILEVVSSALGGKKKGKTKASKRNRKPEMDAGKKEAALLRNIANSGLVIEDS